MLPKRWKVDINATVSAAMLLGGILLPDGALRRRTHDDELAMRSFYAENDLISVRPMVSLSCTSNDSCKVSGFVRRAWVRNYWCAVQAEVQEFKQDRSVMLHTRSTKYGKVKPFQS
eukprot:SAG11_NODE_2120_length_3790_cov_6.378759_3_plen_116_part_00